MEMKKVLSALFCALTLCMGFCNCSSDDDEGEGGGLADMSQLVGSEWKREFSWMNDDGSNGTGTGILKFTSSTSAQEDVTTQGTGWEYNYDLGYEEWKPFHGQSTSLYTYSVSGNTITMTDLEYGHEMTLHMSGDKLVEENGEGNEWQLVEAGDETGDVSGGGSTAYSWTNMQGIWAEEINYQAYLSIISIYQAQAANSSIYTNNSEHGNFRVFCIEFDGEGRMRELNPYMRTVYNNGYPLLLQFQASDNRMVYWTDLKPGYWSNTNYIISENQIYHLGTKRFDILTSNRIQDCISGEFYCKVQ